MPLPLNRLYLAHGLSEPTFGADTTELYYVQHADAARFIYRQATVSGLRQPVTTEPAPSGGVGYGSGVFAVQGHTLIYAAKGGRLVGVDTHTAAQWNLTPPYEGVAAPAIAPDGRFVAFIAEQDGRANVLLVDVRGQHLPVKLSDNPWYAFNPTFAPDGSRVAWMAWDAPVMPWDEARVVVATLARATANAEMPAQLAARGDRGAGTPGCGVRFAAVQPGRPLAGLHQRRERLAIAVDCDADAPDLRAAAVQVDTGPGEIGGPDWVPQFDQDALARGRARLYAIRRHESRASLLRVAWPEQTVTEIETGWTFLLGPQHARWPTAVCGRAAHAPRQPGHAAIRRPAREHVRATSSVGLLNPAELVEPRIIHWPAGGGLEAWGIFYKPPPRPAAADRARARWPDV